MPKYIPEIAVSASAIAGWALCTWTLASLVSAWAWPLSGGLFLLSLCGWRFLAVVAWVGLYSLSRDDE